MEQSIEDRVKEILAKQLGRDVSEITVESRLIDDLVTDSLDAVEIVMALEDEFGVSIPDEDAEQIHTVGDIIAWIKRRLDDDGSAGVGARLKPSPNSGSRRERKKPPT